MSQSKNIIRSFLHAHGITKQRAIDSITSGYDLDEYVAPVVLGVGEILYQYIREPTFFDDSVELGNWFCIKGASMDSLGIFSGLGGRNLTAFEVIADVEALEGTAASIGKIWDKGIGGRGGSTQYFIPRQGRFHLQCLGRAP